MHIDHSCFTCGLPHEIDPIRGCPHQGRARMPTPRPAAVPPWVLAEKEARLKWDIEAREQAESDERRERAYAIARALADEVLAQHWRMKYWRSSGRRTPSRCGPGGRCKSSRCCGCTNAPIAVCGI